MSSTKQWADYPCALIQTPAFTAPPEERNEDAIIGASHMALVHNVIFRGLNSIYLQAPHIPVSERANFITYAKLWSDILHLHHEGEETELFPKIEEASGEKGLMDINVEQHQVFAAGLKQYDEYLSSTTPETFSGEELVRIIDTFRESLHQHLNDEIPTLLGLRKYGGAVSLLKLMDQVGEDAMKNAPKTTWISFFSTNLDRTFENGLVPFPPAPWIVLKLCAYVFPIPNRRLWKFSSCTWTGVPKELPFAPNKSG